VGRPGSAVGPLPPSPQVARVSAVGYGCLVTCERNSTPAAILGLLALALLLPR